jgi:hypothetical protein
VITSRFWLTARTLSDPKSKQKAAAASRELRCRKIEIEKPEILPASGASLTKLHFRNRLNSRTTSPRGMFRPAMSSLDITGKSSSGAYLKIMQKQFTFDIQPGASSSTKPKGKTIHETMNSAISP